MTEAEKQTIKQMVLDGKTIKEISKATGYSHSTITAHTSELRRELLEEKRKVIRELYRSGKSINEICEETGYSRTTVYDATQSVRMGIKDNPTPGEKADPPKKTHINTMYKQGKYYISRY